MTYLLLQTFLLLLASYFLGAILACTAKRAILGSRRSDTVHAGAPIAVDSSHYAPVAVAAPRPISPRPVSPRPAAPPVVPRPIDPVQPRIDVIRRPEPRAIPKLVDPSRFERALMGPDPNEGVPRRAIPEIRPAVLLPVTGAYLPGSYGPPPEPELEPEPEPELVPVFAPPMASEAEPEPFEAHPPVAEFEPIPEPESEPESEPEPEPAPVDTPREKPSRLTSRLSDATTSAAAAAVAAAKAAAAASISSFARRPAQDAPPEPSQQSEPQPAFQAESRSESPPEPLKDEEAAPSLRVAEEPEDIAYEEIVDEHAKEPPSDSHEDHGPVHEDDPESDELLDSEEYLDADEPLPDDDPIPTAVPVVIPQRVLRKSIEDGDDFQRIRAIDSDIEQRLKMEGIDSFEHIASWNAADVKRIGQLLGIPGRVDREQWVEQAQILAKGGETYYSRNRIAAQRAATPIDAPVEIPVPEPAAEEISEVSEPSAPVDEPLVDAPSSESNSDGAETAEVTSVATAAATSVPSIAAAPAETRPMSAAAAIQGRSVSEMAAAAAAAIAAASASVTRGLKPIEPISPLSKVDPKISMPAKLSDAIKEKEAAASAQTPPAETEIEPPRPMSAASHGSQDDLKRIRGIGVLIEKRLNGMGISRYDQIANWTSGEIDRVSQMLEFKGRIEREGWVEQARILLNGGQTEFSRRVDRGEVDTSRET